MPTRSGSAISTKSRRCCFRSKRKMELNPEISPQEAAALMRAGKAILIDVRTPQEYDIARIEGCRLVDDALAKEIVDTWPKEAPIVTVCHHGIRSLSAAMYLRQQG